MCVLDVIQSRLKQIDSSKLMDLLLKINRTIPVSSENVKLFFHWVELFFSIGETLKWLRGSQNERLICRI